MAKYKNAYRDEEDDNKTYSEEFMEKHGKTKDDDDNLPEPTTPEESTFKKRYSDLRRHSQKQSDELKALKEKVEELSRNATGAKLPKSEEEVEAWMKKYPDASAFIDTIARKRAQEMAGSFKQTSEEFEELKSEISKERAFNALLKRHPDFDDIRNSEEFNDWINDRYDRNENDWVWKALFENDTDVDLASDAITFYKNNSAYSGNKKKSERPANKDAARNVSVRSERTEPSGEHQMKFSESQIARESANNRRWYEENEEAIMEALRKGEVEMDITGAAR